MPETTNHSGYEPGITPQMVEAARLALISWYEGCRDFGDGALFILGAAMAEVLRESGAGGDPNALVRLCDS